MLEFGKLSIRDVRIRDNECSGYWCFNVIREISFWDISIREIVFLGNWPIREIGIRDIDFGKWYIQENGIREMFRQGFERMNGLLGNKLILLFLYLCPNLPYRPKNISYCFL